MTEIDRNTGATRLGLVVQITVTSTAATLAALVTAAGKTLPGDMIGVRLSGSGLSVIRRAYDSTADADACPYDASVVSDQIPLDKGGAEALSLWAASDTDIWVEVLR